MVKGKQQALSKAEKKQVAKIAKQVVDANEEDKLYLYTPAVFNGAATDNTGTIQYATFMTQGTSVTNRVGDRIKLKDIEMKMSIASILATGPTLFRLIIGFDLQPGVTNAGASTSLLVTDVIQTADPLSTYQITSQQSGRFRIIFDKYYQLDPINLATGLVTVDTFQKSQFHKKKLNQRIEFAPGGTIPSKGRLFLMMISDQAAGTTPALLLRMWGRFEDA